MRVRREERQERKRIEQYLYDFRDHIVIVEGIKDRKALLDLGCDEDKILCISWGWEKLEEMLNRLSRLSDTSNKPEIKRVIVLTDLDRTGERLAREVSDLILSCGLKPDTRIRRELSGVLHLRYWENLPVKLAKRLKELGD